MDLQPVSMQQQRSVNTAKAAATGAALLGGLSAVAEGSRQSDLIQNAQIHIVKIEANKTLAEFLLESKPDLLKAQKDRCDELIKEIRDFAAVGKLDKKAIVKNGLKMGAMGALIAGGVYYVAKTLMEVYKNNKIETLAKAEAVKSAQNKPQEAKAQEVKPQEAKKP